MDANPQENLYDVFVSYSHREGDWVQYELLPRLEKAGFKVAIDIRILKPNEDLGILREALQVSRTCIPVFSQNYFESEYAPNELRYARQREIRVFPILLSGPKTIPQQFMGIQYFDFSVIFTGHIDPQEAEDLWERLIDAIRGELARNQTSTPSKVGSKFESTTTQQQTAQQEAKPSVLQTESGDTLVTESGNPIGIETPDTSQNQMPARPVENVNVDGNALSDTYSTQDLLGYDDYVQALANFIESPKTKKPITIGIDAVWGGGKTSLMHMLEQRLNPKSKSNKDESQNGETTKQGEHFYTIWFDAWQYDQQEMLWAALVLEILRQIKEQFKWHQKIGLFVRLNIKRFDWTAFFADIFKSVGIAFLLSIVGFAGYYLLASFLGNNFADTFAWLKVYTKVFAALGIATLTYTIFKDTAGLIISPFNLGISRYAKEPDYKSKIGFVNQFKEDFKCVIESVTQNGKWPLVVFIDDLDRCSPSKAAEVIEAVNLLLDSEHCIFIIGMDATMLSRSIQAKYKDIQPFFEDANYPSRIGLGRHFLEKIIQIDFRIPQPDPKHISEFILAQLGRKPAEPSEPSQVSEKTQAAESLIQAEERAGKTREEAKQEVEVNRPDLGEVIEDAKKAVEERAFEEYPEVEKAIQDMAVFLNYNPRRIKRFINMYRLQALIAYERGFLETLISLDNLARWVVISMRWPEFINMVVQDSRIVADIKVYILQVKNAATTEQKNKEIESIKSMGKHPPSLYPLLTDPDFEKLITSIDGHIGEAQNYLGLNQLFMVQ
jgi:hypothetical protein